MFYVYYLTDTCLCHYLFLLLLMIPRISDIGVVCELAATNFSILCLVIKKER
jgi:hypothetical protein